MTTWCDLREELELRRRQLLDELDKVVAWHLSPRVRQERRDELVDEIEQLLETADKTMLRKYSARTAGD